MITNIPMIYSSQLKNANERTFISILWLLSSHNNSPAFFSKEYVSYIGSNRVFDSLITNLTQRNIISYFVKGVGASKHRYFTIVDPAILEELKHTKNQKQTKPQKETQNKSFKECDVEKQAIGREQLSLSSPVSFSDVLSQMQKIATELSELYSFTPHDLEEDAKSYVAKHQGKATRDSMKAWMLQGYAFRQEKHPERADTDKDFENRRRDAFKKIEEFKKFEESQKRNNLVDVEAEVITEENHPLKVTA